ncbi:MAG TPA: NAD(P)-dependent oxidoreductase [Acidobacteriaceae bacterium]|jgi:phosphoglycerate dehydrogenase-like enzyme
MHLGLPEEIDPDLFRFLPDGVDITRIGKDLTGGLHLDMWVLPLQPRQAAAALPHIHSVQVVQSQYAGVDAFLSFVPPGATLCDAQGVHDAPVAEWILTAILASLKYIPFYVRLQDRGDWKQRSEAEKIYLGTHPGAQPMMPPALEDELLGKTVLIVGYGSIGRATEERLKPFDVNVVRVGRRRRAGVQPEDRLDELLPQADIVVLLVPLTDETRGFFNGRRLAAMKHGALLVNAARGPVVHTDALVEALYAGRIRAVVDVTDPEPLPLGHPLWSAPNLLITPHIAGSSPGMMDRVMRLIGDQCRRYLAGEPLAHIVTEGY